MVVARLFCKKVIVRIIPRLLAGLCPTFSPKKGFKTGQNRGRIAKHDESKSVCALFIKIRAPGIPLQVETPFSSRNRLNLVASSGQAIVLAARLAIKARNCV
jgi:hypothetical protein